jgi:hypothetical protein
MIKIVALFAQLGKSFGQIHGASIPRFPPRAAEPKARNAILPPPER